MTVINELGLKCPQCGSDRLYKDGLRYLKDGSSLQRWLCRSCAYRFSQSDEKLNIRSQIAKRPDPKNDLSHNVLSRLDLSFKKPFDYLPFLFGEDVASHRRPSVEQKLNSLRDCNRTRQVCVSKGETKNLSATETKTGAGESQQLASGINGQLLEFAWKMKKRGLAEGTIKNRTYRLSILVKKGADLMNADSVETLLATEKWTPSSKSDFVAAYRSFTKAFNIPWTPIRVRYEPKQPFIPLESEIDQLIAGCGKRTATFLQVLKDTGARAGEVTKLQWTDVNSQNNTISINDPEKGSKSRTVKVSAKTIAMINAMSKKYGNHIFNPRVQAIQDSFWRSRMKLARTLQNPRLLQIHFHTLRHFKATMEYHRTRDILYVKQLLGHKRLENTEIYTHLIEFENDEYHSATAKTIEEAKQLIETGFEYVTEMEDIKLFRKRK